MPQLVSPTPRLHAAWLARDDWGRGVHQDGSGLRESDDVDSAVGFAAWCEWLLHQSDPSRAPAPGRVHATYWWIVEEDEVLGAISLRHELNDSSLRRAATSATACAHQPEGAGSRHGRSVRCSGRRARSGSTGCS